MKTFQLCREFHVLPKAGGWGDQDYRTREYFYHIMACFAEKKDEPHKMAELKAIAMKAKRGR